VAYQTYTTEALVCGTFNKNTADRSYLLFTREAGMLYAEAKSAREERSRQRMALQDFSHIRVSLVKGKRGWRIGSVEPIVNHYTKAVDKAARGSVVSIYRWLRRFYKGEEATPQLYDYILSALNLATGEMAERNMTEEVVKLRILTDLGYVDTTKVPSAVLTKVGNEVLSKQDKEQVEQLLSQAVLSSHL
jgi:recombinational DNA repair protein (RecF pathway)